MQAVKLTRKFIYGKKTFPDIDGFSPEEVKDTYANTNPELLNSSIINKGFSEKENAIVFEFKASAGTKG